MDSPPQTRRSTLAPLRNPVFRAVWLASLVSNFGGLVQSVGSGWLMASISTSDDMVALVQASTSLPLMLFSLAAGAIADNFDKRRVIIIAQLFMLIVSVVLAIFAYQGWVTPWMLLAFTFLIGCGAALNNPAWQASVGDMVGREDLPAAVNLNSIGFNLVRSVGPAIGGAIVAAAGAAAAFAVNAVSYVALIFVIHRWKPDTPKSSLPRESFGRAMTAGLRYVSMSPHIETVLFRGFLFGATGIVILSLMPLIARDLLQGDALTYGILLGFFGIGAIGGAMLSGRLREKLSTEWIVRGAFIGFAACCIACSQATTLWLAGPGLLIGGACWVLAQSLFNTTVQLSTPRWVVGRALALYQTCIFGGMALGAWLWGLNAETYGARNALLVAAVFLVIGALVGLRFPVPPLLAPDLDPLNRFQHPNLALDLKPQSGPIFITIEFIIAEENLPAFLDVMKERRRVRLRDGARQWELMRDLENPQIWRETYHAPTWVEYVRHNQRATREDGVIGEKLRALHEGDGPPRVQRMIVRPTNWAEAALPLKNPTDIH